MCLRVCVCVSCVCAIVKLCVLKENLLTAHHPHSCPPSHTSSSLLSTLPHIILTLATHHPYSSPPSYTSSSLRSTLLHIIPTPVHPPTHYHSSPPSHTSFPLQSTLPHIILFTSTRLHRVLFSLPQPFC